MNSVTDQCYDGECETCFDKECECPCHEVD